MSLRIMRSMAGPASVALLALALASDGSVAQQPTIKKPEPGVPEIFTIQGQFTRVAYNNEGYVSLGYRVANRSVGEKWLLLEIGATVRDGQPNYPLTREALSLETPDGKTIPLASNDEYMNADLRGLDSMANGSSDPINYFPPGTVRACRIGFFSGLEDRAKSWDRVELSSQLGCLGRIYFHVPDGIQYGQHWLNVRFDKSVVRVPFRILTKEEEKTFSKSWQDISKQLEESFKKK